MQDDFEIKTLSSVQEIEEYRSIWEELISNEAYPVINADIDRYISIVNSSQGKIKPYIIVAYKHDCPVSMLVGRLEVRNIKLAIGYKKLLDPSFYCLTIVYGGIVGDSSGHSLGKIFEHLVCLFRDREIELIWFNHIKTDSKTLNLIKYLVARKKLSICVGENETHRSLKLPESLDDFYKARSKKHRNHLRGYIRKIERDFLDSFRVVCYNGLQDLEQAMADIYSISKETYQYQIGNGFGNDIETKHLFAVAARKRWLFAYVLYLHDKPVAFRIMLKYQLTYLGNGVGYLPEYSNYRVGTVLFLKVLEDICSKKEADIYDFGFGDAEYKRNYCDIEWSEVPVYIFSHRFYPRFISIIFNALKLSNVFLRHTLVKLGVVNRVKRKWRDRLQKRGQKKD